MPAASGIGWECPRCCIINAPFVETCKACRTPVKGELPKPAAPRCDGSGNAPWIDDGEDIGIKPCPGCEACKPRCDGNGRIHVGDYIKGHELYDLCPGCEACSGTGEGRK